MTGISLNTSLLAKDNRGHRRLVAHFDARGDERASSRVISFAVTL